MIDLLVFGPHPDDLEIGMGGTIARHTSLGMRVGLCDLTAGEMGSNGTPDERLAEAEAARLVLGAVWRDEPALAGSAHWKGSGSPRRGGVVHPPASAQGGRDSVLVRSASRSRGGQRAPDRSLVQRRAAPLRGAGRGLEADWICYYFINDSATPSFVVDVSDYYEQKRLALECHATQFTPPAPGSPCRRA